MPIRPEFLLRHAVVAILMASATLTPLRAGAQNTVAAAPAHRQTAQLSFASPQAAADALLQAARAGDSERLRSILGRGARRVLSSGDAAADESTRQSLLAAADTRQRVEMQGDSRAVLSLGANDWPLPFPIVKAASGQWRFDTRAGLQEFLDRQIGQNELAAIQTVLAYVDAQREYVMRDRNRDGLLEYAQRIVSSEGKRDGLYWPTEAGEPPSPMGSAFAAAGREPLQDKVEAPYHGYYFRILKGQGPAAAGGESDYVVRDQMIGGFALVAYPARWGVSGVMSFVVNHEGVVYSRNLGPQTTAIAGRMERYNPDAGWKKEVGN